MLVCLAGCGEEPEPSWPWPKAKSNCVGTCIKMIGPVSAPIAPDRVITYGAMQSPECDIEKVAIIETSPRFAKIDDLWRFFQAEAAKLGADRVDMRHIDNENYDYLYRGSVLAFRCMPKTAPRQENVPVGAGETPR